ncbi:SMP-30/gluconolactonase/LRE family protein [Oxalobacteraceae bacterium]|nr:SMP-30/gluconolactonase/LRE family protein [Oxalobacteraceae bacterium]
MLRDGWRRLGRLRAAAHARPAAARVGTDGCGKQDQANPLLSWKLDRKLIEFVGEDLQRPACILARPDGTLLVADARGGVMHIASDGSQRLLPPENSAGANASAYQSPYLHAGGSLPNGLVLLDNGDMLIANWGRGSIDLLTPQGALSTLHDSIDGQPIGKANFLTRDSLGHTWLSVTTCMSPWSDALIAGVLDGYIARMDGAGLHLVAGGLGGPTEMRLDASEEWLYVAESGARRISRLRVQSDGTLGEAELFGPPELDGFPGGCAFDAHGNLWVTLIMSDKLIALTPTGEVLELLDDGDPEASAALNRHVAARKLTPALMVAARGTLAPWMSSITFGGPDLCTVYLGSMMGERLPSFRSPLPGLPLAHWKWPAPSASGLSAIQST